MTTLTKRFMELKHYFMELLVLSVPLLLGNIGHTLIGVSDIFVVAKYNINSLAAISIANSILFSIFIFGLGILDAITIVLSNMRGAHCRIREYLFSSLLFSLVTAAIFTVICYSTKYLIDYIGFDYELIPYIKEYISIVAFSMFGMFLFQGIKQYLQAYEIVKLPNFIILWSVLVNLFFDIVFVFGFGIIPAMGSKGAAIATLTVRTLMGIVMFFYIYKKINFKASLDFSYIKQLIKIGAPIGMALTLEFFAFNIITILAGREAGILSAVHNILVSISSITFMVPLSFAAALAIKVSFFFGAKNPEEIKKYSLTALLAGSGFMLLASVVLMCFPSQVIRLFTDNKEVIQIAVPIVAILAMYQVFDGFQVIAGGILRGFKMTKAVSLFVLTGYWVVGAPIAYVLVYKKDYSLKGYWIALAVSLLFMGIFQALFAKYRYHKLKKECRMKICDK